MTTKTLAELDCYMQWSWNSKLECWNGCLTRNHSISAPKSSEGIYNFIKCFVHDTKLECSRAAEIWANNNKRQLTNYKGDPN